MSVDYTAVVWYGFQFDADDASATELLGDGSDLLGGSFDEEALEKFCAPRDGIGFARGGSHNYGGPDYWRIVPQGGFYHTANRFSGGASPVALEAPPDSTALTAARDDLLAAGVACSEVGWYFAQDVT